MKLLRIIYSLVWFLHVGQVISNPNCPIYGAEFPKPRQLAENPTWKTAMANLSKVFDALESPAENYSYAVQVFSINPGQQILFERYHTAKNLPDNTTGVKTVDQDTVFRLGSVTKIFTVLTFLSEVGDKYFNHPITEFIPELAELSLSQANAPRDGVRTVDWEEITLLSLASQMSGIERDCELSQTV
jgi:CubicO group peptidase (beta-lactamase class C family)